MSKQTSPRNLTAWFALAQTVLWLWLPFSGSVATSEAQRDSFDTWKKKCNCSCLNKKRPVERLEVQDCIQEEIFSIDDQDNILRIKPLHLNLSKLAVGHLMCSRRRNSQKDFKFLLVTLNCTAKRGHDRGKQNKFYTILRQTDTSKLLPKRTKKSSLIAAASSAEKQEGKTERKRGGPSTTTTLVVGLNVGLALVIGVVVSFLCIRHSKQKPTLENKKNEQDYPIDENEDSRPYRILDLSTQVAYDASGYTFLEASKKEEENPYQKLNASSTKNDKNIAPGDKKYIDVTDVDEPVYFVLEGTSDVKDGF